MSSRAMPWDSNSVMSFGDVRPAADPDTTSHSSRTLCHVNSPRSTGCIRSAHSNRACSTSSATMTLDRATALPSSSRRSQWFTPAALTCVPSGSHSPSSTGDVAEVMTATTSASPTHSSAEPTAFTSMSRLAAILAAKAFRRSAVLLKTLTRSTWRTRHMASSCVSAW